MGLVVLRRADGRFRNKDGGWNRLFSMAHKMPAYTAAFVAISEGVEGIELLDAETQQPIETQQEWLALAEESISIEAAKALLANKIALLKQKSS